MLGVLEKNSKLVFKWSYVVEADDSEQKAWENSQHQYLVESEVGGDF